MSTGGLVLPDVSPCTKIQPLFWCQYNLRNNLIGHPVQRVMLVTLPGHPGVDAVLLLEQVDGDGQRGRGGRGTESRCESIRHVGDKPEIQLYDFFSN